jgi:adenosylmethionine-8-amino-7-oxononanoate aminotransferase
MLRTTMTIARSTLDAKAGDQAMHLMPRARNARGHLLLHFTQNGAYGPQGDELLVLERGEGCHVIDSRGRRYLDAMSSLFCAQIGYSYGPEMAAAATTQLERLPFATNWAAAHPAAIELAERLAARAPDGIEHVFFTSGGSESVEAAWKLARLHHLVQGEPQRRKAIARKVAYHGVTLGALALTGVEAFKRPFDPPAIHVRHVSHTGALRRPENGDDLCRVLLDEIESAISEEGPDEIALLIAEPVQNAGGCFTPPDGYWRGLREICDRYGILLVADEVITGCGRLGEWFGIAREGVSPDLITLAKGLTSAHAPMGAVMVGERVARALLAPDQTLLHGITFGGHPVAAAMALRNIEIFARDRVLENVRENERYFAAQLDALRQIPIVGDIRGAGFFWALELVADRDGRPFSGADREQLVRRFLPARLLAAGLIARADDRGEAVLHLAPPLIANRAILDEIVGKVGVVLEEASRHRLSLPKAVA